MRSIRQLSLHFWDQHGLYLIAWTIWQHGLYSATSTLHVYILCAQFAWQFKPTLFFLSSLPSSCHLTFFKNICRISVFIDPATHMHMKGNNSYRSVLQIPQNKINNIKISNFSVFLSRQWLTVVESAWNLYI